MNYCEHCGNKLKSSDQFCGNCGARLERDIQPVKIADYNLNQSQNQNYNQPSIPTHQTATNSIPITRNKKLIGIVGTVAIAIILFNFLPKKLNEQEYVQFAIHQIAGFTADYYNFTEYLDNSDIDLDGDDYSVAEGKVLLEPAKQYQKKVGQRYKDIKKIKPPKPFEYEHENLLKGISSFENAAAAFVSFIETGDEHYEDVFDQHEEMAESFLEDSIFLNSDLYENQLEELYYELMGF